MRTAPGRAWASACACLAGRSSTGGGSADVGTLADRVTAFERDVVLTQLAAHGWRPADTARALGLERSHPYKKCQQLASI